MPEKALKSKTSPTNRGWNRGKSGTEKNVEALMEEWVKERGELQVHGKEEVEQNCFSLQNRELKNEMKRDERRLWFTGEAFEIRKNSESTT